jgi:hypothetical protein
LVKDEDDQIAWIVEVETGDAGKAVAGAAILANICMEMEKTGPIQQKRAKLLFVFYNPYANLKLAGKRLNPLEIIKPMTETEALKTISKLGKQKELSLESGG